MVLGSQINYQDFMSKLKSLFHLLKFKTDRDELSQIGPVLNN